MEVSPPGPVTARKPRRFAALAAWLRGRREEILSDWEHTVRDHGRRGGRESSRPFLVDDAPGILERAADVAEALADRRPAPDRDPDTTSRDGPLPEIADVWVEYVLLRRCIARRAAADVPELGIDDLMVVNDVIDEAATTTAAQLARLHEREAQQQYRRNEAWNTAILEAALDCVVSMDADDRIIGWNAAAERTFGYSRAEALGREVPELIIPPHLRERHRRGLARYLATGEERYFNRRLEMSGLRKDGTEFPVELIITRIAVPGPPVFTGHIRDITERHRAQEALRRSETRYRLVTEATADAIWDWNLETDTFEWSAAVGSLFGYPEAEIGPDPTWWYEHIHPDDRERVVHGVHAFIAGTGHSWKDEYCFRHRDGHYVMVADHGAIERDARGKGVRMAGAMQDIDALRAAQRDLERSEEQFRTLANSIPQLAWMADETGYIFWYNQRWYDYTGTTFDEVRGWGWQNVHHPEHVARVVDHIRRTFESGEVWEDTFPLRSRTGEYRRFLSRALPIRDEHGRVVRWFGTNTDIEERLRAEEELERRIGFEEQLIGIVSHDLRNPIGAIQLGSTMLLQQALDERQANTVKRVLSSAERAGRLVDDLLDFTRERMGKGMPLVRQPADLRELAHAVLEEIRLAHPRRKIEEHHEGDGRGEWDTDRLAQVLTNLVGNALAYSPADTAVRVTTGGDGDAVVLEVHNAGAPIAPEVLARLFEPFERAGAGAGAAGHAVSRSVGLGLFIVDRIVHAHGGTVDVRSTADAGTTFRVRLPRSAPPSPADQAARV